MPRYEIGIASSSVLGRQSRVSNELDRLREPLIKADLSGPPKDLLGEIRVEIDLVDFPGPERRQDRLALKAGVGLYDVEELPDGRPLSRSDIEGASLRAFQADPPPPDWGGVFDAEFK